MVEDHGQRGRLRARRRLRLRPGHRRPVPVREPARAHREIAPAGDGGLQVFLRPAARDGVVGAELLLSLRQRRR